MTKAESIPFSQRLYYRRLVKSFLGTLPHPQFSVFTDIATIRKTMKLRGKSTLLRKLLLGRT